jgi:hypothetical protein
MDRWIIVLRMTITIMEISDGHAAREEEYMQTIQQQAV